MLQIYQTVFSHFCSRKCNIFVKLNDSSLAISAVPLSFSAIFFLLFFQMANSASATFWIVSRFLSALSVLRLMLSCLRLRSRSRCMFSIAQCRLVIRLKCSALLSILAMYSLCSDVLLPSDFFSVDVSISMTVKFPPHFSLSAISSAPRNMLHVLDSILPCSNRGLPCRYLLG